jgi:hypothetical protein
MVDAGSSRAPTLGADGAGATGIADRTSGVSEGPGEPAFRAEGVFAAGELCFAFFFFFGVGDLCGPFFALDFGEADFALCGEALGLTLGLVDSSGVGLLCGFGVGVDAPLFFDFDFPFADLRLALGLGVGVADSAGRAVENSSRFRFS